MQQASDYELEIMKIIWANGGAALYAKIVTDLEARGNSLTKNTTTTLLSRLVDKGMLKTSKSGQRNSNIYIAVVSESEYQVDQTTRFVDKIFEGNTKELITALVENDMIPQNDHEELLKYLRSGGKSK